MEKYPFTVAHLTKLQH